MYSTPLPTFASPPLSLANTAAAKARAAVPMLPDSMFTKKMTKRSIPIWSDRNVADYYTITPSVLGIGVNGEVGVYPRQPYCTMAKSY